MQHKMKHATISLHNCTLVQLSAFTFTPRPKRNKLSLARCSMRSTWTRVCHLVNGGGRDRHDHPPSKTSCNYNTTACQHLFQFKKKKVLLHYYIILLLLWDLLCMLHFTVYGNCAQSKYTMSTDCLRVCLPLICFTYQQSCQLEKNVYTSSL